MQTLTDIQQAAALGKQAFDTGRKCVPVQDAQFQALIARTQGPIIPLLDAWLKAWTQANLNAPVECS